MQKWEDVEDVEALRETAAKLGVQGTADMDREQLIEALNTAEVSPRGADDSATRADAQAAFGDGSRSS